MKNLKTLDTFIFEKNTEPEKTETQKQIDANKEFDKQIADLTSELKKANDAGEKKAAVKLRLELNVVTLKKELSNTEYKLKQMD